MRTSSGWVQSFLVIATLAACRQGVAAPTPVAAVTEAGSGQASELGDVFTLGVGDRASFAGVSFAVQFVGVAEDSRCPLDTTCVWAGDGVVTLDVTDGNETMTLDLHTHPSNAQSRSYAGFTAQLVDLAPHPEANKPVDTGTYIASLLVTAGQ